MQTIGNYEIQEEIGCGGYGKVYKVKHLITRQLFAMKTSNLIDKSLPNESQILKYLKGSEADNGIPKYYEHGKTSQLNYLVMELLGKNLQTEHICLNGTFSLGCIIAIGLQLIERIEYIHSRNVIHRDIKPQQLLLSQDGSRICLADFGLATKYIRKNIHKPFKTNSITKGSVSFASVHTHMGFRQSRRDDLESLFYTLAYLRLGRLPWQDSFRGLEGVQKWNICLTSKMFHFIRLFSSFPTEFGQMFQYIRLIKYDQDPDYSFFRKKFERCASRLKMPYIFDWDGKYSQVHKLSSAETLASSSCSRKPEYSTNSFSKASKCSKKQRRRKSHRKYSEDHQRIIESFDTEKCDLPEFKNSNDNLKLQKFSSYMGVDIQNSKYFGESEHTQEGVLPEFGNRLTLKVL